MSLSTEATVLTHYVYALIHGSKGQTGISDLYEHIWKLINCL